MNGHPRRRSRRSTVLLAALVAVAGVAFATAFAFAATRMGSHGGQAGQQTPRPTGIPANVSTSLAYRMQLSPVPDKLAPGFTLTDQNGRPVSLASLRGKAVVLTFMDPHCTDVCPIISREFLDAYHDLGAAASKVVFVAVNVNPYHRQVATMAAYSREQQLSSLASWHFVTGPLPSLKAVWGDYQVMVDAPNPNADVIHTSVVYFIDPSGHERYVIAPMDDHTRKGTAYLPANQMALWAHGIALVTKDVLSGH